MRYTEILALALGNVAAAQFTTTRFANTTTEGFETGTATTDTAGETTTAATGGIGDPDGFNFLGCFSSENGFPGFVQAYSNEDNDAETCGDACLGSNFFGLYDNTCYCGSVLDLNTSPAVGTDQCDIVCPGNDNENCGGLSGNALMRRQVGVNVLLSIYVAIGVNPGETDTVINTDFITETLPAVTTTATVTFTEDGTTSTATVTKEIVVVPTDVIIICYGNYCAPQVHCPTCTKWQIVCHDGLCAPEQCYDDTWHLLKICNSGKCHYSDYKEEECNQRIVCYGSHCERDQHYSIDYAKKFVCDVDEDRYYFDDCKDDCYSYEKCSHGECEPVHPPVHPEPPVHPPVKPTHPIYTVPKPPVKPTHPIYSEPKPPVKPTHPIYTEGKPAPKPTHPVEPEHPAPKPEHPAPPAPKPEHPAPPAPEHPAPPAETGSNSKPQTPEHPPVIAGAAKQTFAGVAAIIAGFVFIL
ncbi:neurofilament medium polypeptide [Fusarium longipes]|uniref:Neurofilament medium polypeptide n=1 Tax=Fusarium longipes TaxID=694270 RepID=A0A395SZ94_9HYPO|nr:neurofilament medium polypeptide [Fusarium longipes]